MKQGKVFQFGQNWKDFSEGISEETLSAARSSLSDLAGDLTGKTFLDIGSGSGLFALSAAQLGAKRVTGFDVDPISVQTSIQNANRFLPHSPVEFHQISILDREKTARLGLFDVVYSWGVLHHTGDMKQAFENAASLVAPNGLLVIAIYNRHVTSPIWKVIKKIYNHMPKFLQDTMIWMLFPVIFLAKFVFTGKNPLRMKRGMDFMHNVIDWVGGYPYEYASESEVTAMIENMGYRLQKAIPALVPTGCNEFVFVRGDKNK